MKKYIVLPLLLLSVFCTTAQTLIQYGPYAVSREEFLRAYTKNKTSVADKEKSVREYVELYAHFKMKVKEAQLMKLDTSESYKNDLEQFRRQIEENYLSDEATVQQLVDEALARRRQDLRIVRYTANMDDVADPADTLARYQALQQVYRQLSAGQSPDAALPEGVRRTDMGFITAFTLPYVYENIVYGLKKGQTAAPYRAKKAWHVFQVTDVRPGSGKWKVAQLLFTSPDNADETTRIRARHLADSVYGLLMQGGDFASLARQFSDDKLTYLNGGEMPEFGTGQYESVFEEQVLALSRDNAFSRPFQSSFGWHIVKRLAYTPPVYDPRDDNARFEAKQKVMQDDRIRIAKDKFTRDVMTRLSMKTTTGTRLEDVYRYADSMVTDEDPETRAHSLPLGAKTLLTFKGGSRRGTDWLLFAANYRSNPDLYKGEPTAQLWEQFRTLTALEEYRARLEEYNPEFRHQMQEFREGNLLFDIMERRVWNRAANDTAGLKTYYEQHASEYKWAASADMVIWNAVNETLAQEALDDLKVGSDWRQLVEQKQGELQADSGRFELAQVSTAGDVRPGSYSAVTRNPDGTAQFVQVLRLYPEGQLRRFDDAKGMVVNDYQGVVEKQWIEELRKKYPLKVNEALLKQVISSL